MACPVLMKTQLALRLTFKRQAERIKSTEVNCEVN